MSVVLCCLRGVMRYIPCLSTRLHLRLGGGGLFVDITVCVYRTSSLPDIHGLRVSPLDVAAGWKLHIIHGLTFAGRGYRSTVNGNVYFSAAGAV